MRSVLRSWLLMLLLVPLAGCASEPIQCGSTTCTGGEVCVQPCCGGAPVQCMDPDGGGACPAGTAVGTCFRNGSPSSGCAQQCVPGAPFCAPPPSGSSNPCGGGGGHLVNGRYECICA